MANHSVSPQSENGIIDGVGPNLHETEIPPSPPPPFRVLLLLGKKRNEPGLQETGRRLSTHQPSHPARPSRTRQPPRVLVRPIHGVRNMTAGNEPCPHW